MKSIIAFTVMTALLVSAYPHDTSQHELVKKEHTLTDFAKSVESCDTRFHLSLYGGKMPGYEDIAPYKIGPSFHPQTAIISQMQVKYIWSSPNAGLGMAFVLPSDIKLTAYKGTPESGCNRVMISPDSHSTLWPATLNSTSWRRDPTAARDPAVNEMDFNMAFSTSLYDATIWSSRAQDDLHIVLWPYLNELKYFSQCQTPWCTSRDQVLAVYKDALDFKGLSIENVNEQKWSPEAFEAVLASCDSTPVFFTDITKTENPAWIVSKKEDNGWRMDIVRSADEQEQSVHYTLDDIISKVLPTYPDIVYVKPSPAVKTQN